ncbi:hypothetical protein ACFL1I_01050 [Candidatus Omnitrophota bacterium]
MSRARPAGFTLMELMFGAVVLTITLGGMIAVFTGNFVLVDSGRNLTVAVNHAQCVIEEIRDRNIPGFVVIEDWTAWAQADIQVGGGGCNSLPNEVVQVTYPSGTGAVPLELVVTVSWTEKSRAKNTQLVTLLAER